MSLPDLVRGELEGEEPVARVALGGDDELFVTGTRTLVYRADGLLSDERVEECPHDAERVSVAESRRKATLTLDYGLDGEETVTVPAKHLERVLHPVIAGVIAAADITDQGETVERTFRFSELTLVVTSSRLVKHVGAAVWDGEFEEFRYEDVTDVRFEEGNVATSVVLSANGRQERFKAPASEARVVRETLAGALCAYYGVETLEAFRGLSSDADGGDEREGATGTVDFGDGPEPLSANPAAVTDETDPPRENPRSTAADEEGAPADAAAASGSAGGPGPAGVDDGFAESGFETAAPTDEAAELAALRRAVERQGERLDRQSELIERLIEELRHGR